MLLHQKIAIVKFSLILSLIIALLWPFLFLLFDGSEVSIHYLGHSCFLIDFDNRITVLTDYGAADAWEDYGWSSPITSIGDITPDIVTYSHPHADHFDSTRIIGGNPLVYMGGSDIDYHGLKIQTIRTSESDVSIKDNNSYLFEYKGLKVLHMGDCQADIIALDSMAGDGLFTASIPGNCDILLFPIESTMKFARQAEQFVRQTSARVYIPMHYWSNEYKQSFLARFRNRSSAVITTYKVITTPGSDFTYKRKKHKYSVKIIDMKPGKAVSE